MEHIETALENYLASKNIEGIAPELTPAPENTGADFSTNLALKLAKPLKTAPLKIAEEIQSTLKALNCEIAIAAPGFINFTLKDAYWQSALETLETDPLTSDLYQSQTLLTEFSDPNPFKVLHVGHLYTSVVGDSISRLLENAGGDVKRLNFGGDVGLHVAKNLYILKDQDLEKYRTASPAEKAELLGRCYVEGTRAYEDDASAKREITELNQLIYEISKNGPDYKYDDDETAKIAELYWWGREASYDYFADFYQSLGLKFDEFIPESSVADLGKEIVLKNTPSTYEKSDGAIIFRGEDYGLHTRVFINKEGIPTYEAKDVGLIFKKDAKYHFDQSIVITGDEQREYMRVVMKSIEQYAPDLIKKSAHLTHGMVKLPGAVKMSSRKGNFLKATELLEHVRFLVAMQCDEEGAPEGDALKVRRLRSASSEEAVRANKIALGAIKYTFLKSKLGGDIELDIKESVSMTGNSGPYLQYSAVRAKKILEKSTGSSSNNNLSSSFEKSLIRKLANYEPTLKEATEDLAPHKLATYLYDLAQEFSRFYENCPVAGSDNEAFRLKIVKTYLKVITHGLNLLGIEIPERM